MTIDQLIGLAAGYDDTILVDQESNIVVEFHSLFAPSKDHAWMLSDSITSQASTPDGGGKSRWLKFSAMNRWWIVARFFGFSEASENGWILIGLPKASTGDDADRLLAEAAITDSVTSVQLKP